MIDSWMERLMLEHMRERKRKADVQLNGRIKETIGELLAIVAALFFAGAMVKVETWEIKLATTQRQFAVAPSM